MQWLAMAAAFFAAWAATRAVSAWWVSAASSGKGLSWSGVAAARLEKAEWFRLVWAGIQRNLRRSGLRGDAAQEFVARSVTIGVLIALVATVVALTVIGGTLFLFAPLLGLMYVLVIAPHGLAADAERRSGRLVRELPYAIDLSGLVLGGGGTLREALEMVAAGDPGSPLVQELRIALEAVRAGSTLQRALGAMAHDLEIEDLSSLVGAINRSEETGAPVARSLETQAEIFRFRRLQRAEKIAVEAPVKMMFPNMLILMAVLLLILGPALIGIARNGLF